MLAPTTACSASSPPETTISSGRLRIKSAAAAKMLSWIFLRAVLDGQIGSLYQPKLAQFGQERAVIGFRRWTGQGRAEEADPKNPRRLGACCEWPSDCRTAEQGDERPPLQLIKLHSVPSPARAGSQDIELTTVSQRVSWTFCNRSAGRLHTEVWFGSCVTSIASPHGGAQLYER